MPHPIYYMTHGIPHILVIDDNEAILETVATVLRWHALRVSTSNGQDECYTMVHELKPNLIILDKMLGPADGCELCTRIKTDSQLRSVSVIMFSAFINAEQPCLAAGADAFLAKPFDLSELLHLVRLYTSPVLLPS